MTFKEAALRIQDHIVVHRLKEKQAIKITEALTMAVRLLLWMEDQPEWILEGNIIEAIEEYYDMGCRDGWRRCEREMKCERKEDA